MCSYCGKQPDTKDHVPPKVLLDMPFPENMHKVDCCFECNQGFSTDEVYFACLIECIIHGSVNVKELSREKIKRILTEKEHLRKKISNCMSKINDSVLFNIDQKAVENVLLKLARGHAAFEASQPKLEKPKFFAYKPLYLMSDIEKTNFFSLPEVEIYPEVGSRLFNQIVFDENNTPFSFWIPVQDEVYMYLITSQVSQFSVRIVIYNYLAVEIIWSE